MHECYLCGVSKYLDIYIISRYLDIHEFSLTCKLPPCVRPLRAAA